MSSETLGKTAQALVGDDKGLLAMDESVPTCNQRFAALGIEQSEEKRRSYRDLIVTTPRLSESISGVILCDETFSQLTRADIPFPKYCEEVGLIPGIKVDRGTEMMAGHAGEKITEGLDGLRARLVAYAESGARFAKWRAVFSIGKRLPSEACVEANANALARYACLCQEAGLVPIVEPEVLMAGQHTIEQTYETTRDVLQKVFAQLYRQGVMLEGLLLKPNMISSGLSCPTQASESEVADATVRCLKQVVPAAVPGVAFLSGGQTAALASARLNIMNLRYKRSVPWAISFSFARAIQQPALKAWAGKDKNLPEAQQELLRRAECNKAARKGEYEAEMELEKPLHIALDVQLGKAFRTPSSVSSTAERH